MEEGAPPAAAIVGGQFEMLEEYQKSQRGGVAGFMQAQVLEFGFAERRDRLLQGLAERRCQGIGRKAFIEETALHSTVSTNRRRERFPDVEVYHLWHTQGRPSQGTSQENQESLVLLQKLFRHRNVLVGQCFGIRREELFVLVGLPKVLAIERAIDADFALGTAAKRAYVAPHSEAEAPRPASLTNGASHSPSIKVKGASNG